MADKTLGYKLVPIKEERSGMVMTAALNTCFITGKVITSMGGGCGASMVPEAYRVLVDDEEVQALIRQKIALLSSNPVG